MPWNDTFECMPVADLQKLQLEKLKETVVWTYERVPFYRRKLEELKIKPDDIQCLEDVAKLPFTVKNDLGDNYPFGLCAVPEGSGAGACFLRNHGKPITGPYTADDLEQWTEHGQKPVVSRLKTRRYHSECLWTRTFYWRPGIYRALPVWAVGRSHQFGPTERQIMLMKDFGSTALFSTPSYALTIAEKSRGTQSRYQGPAVRVGVFGAEPWTIAMREEIEPYGHPGHGMPRPDRALRTRRCF